MNAYGSLALMVALASLGGCDSEPGDPPEPKAVSGANAVEPAAATLAPDSAPQDPKSDEAPTASASATADAKASTAKTPASVDSPISDPVHADDPPIEKFALPTKPPKLSLAFDGDCFFGMTVKDADTYVYFNKKIQRLDEKAAPAETWTLDVATFESGKTRKARKARFSSIGLVMVHEPGNFHVLASFDGPRSLTRLFAVDSRGTTLVDPSSPPLDGRIDIRELWRWPTGSVLAVARNGGVPVVKQKKPVVAVVQGSPLVLDSAPVWKGDPCPFPSHWDTHVVPGGPVTALHGCQNSWVSVWTPDDPTGTHVELHPNSDGGMLALNDRAEGYILAKGRYDYKKPSPDALYRWKGGTATEIEGPASGTTHWLELDPQGNPWLAIDNEVFRREGERWVSVPLPKDQGPYGLSGGIGVGTPWILGTELHMQTADGRWHQVARPDATHEEAFYVGIHRIHVVAPDDVFFVGLYPHELPSGLTGRKVLYTTRPAERVHTCKAHR